MKPSREPNVYAGRTVEQVHAYQYFVQSIVPNITRVISSNFWDRYLLQISSTDQVVWLAINAMSELVRCSQPPGHTWTESMTVTRRQSALRWYARSVSDLQASITNDSIPAMLCGTTAILYFCIECVLENLDNALSIYLRATSLIATSTSQSSNTPDNAVLEAIAMMLDHIAAAHGLRSTSSSLFRQMFPSKPMTVEAARDMLTRELMVEAHEFATTVQYARTAETRDWLPPPETRAKGVVILARLNWWNSTVTALRQADPSSVNGLNWSLMHIVRLTYVIWVSAMMNATELAFDQYDHAFAELLHYVRNAVEAGVPTQPLFTFDTRVIPSLTFAATRCREPYLRREALRLLFLGPVVENSRKASSAIAMVQRVIAIEEGGDVKSKYYYTAIKNERPSRADRMFWAKVDQSESRNGRITYTLRFGRWRLDNAGQWYLTNESAELGTA